MVELSQIPNKVASYISVSENASQQLKNIIASNKIVGIRVGVRRSGCAGMKYIFTAMQKVEQIQAKDEVWKDDDFIVAIDPAASLFIFGAELDYKEISDENGIPISAEFYFQNPNEKGKCGCGESFYT